MTAHLTPGKRALRASARAARASLPVDDLSAQGVDLSRHLAGLPELSAATVVSAYVSVGREPSTSAVLSDLRARGFQVLLPVVLPDLDLEWCLDDDTLAVGIGPGVPEPQGERLGPDAVARADVVVVPALLVDLGGRRLGQGGGSFDRALARARPDALVVALVHDHELVEGPLPVEAHDRPVDVVLTPSGGVHRVSRLGR